MTASGDHAAFEQRLGALLQESTARVSGRVRSRLNRARHEAVAQAFAGGRVRRGALRRPALWMPAAGVVAATMLVTFMVWPRHSDTVPTASAAKVVATGDLDLLTDRDGLSLIEGGNGEFYEWAANQAQAQPAPAGSAGGQGANGS